MRPNQEDRDREERIKQLKIDQQRIQRINEEQERRLEWVYTVDCLFNAHILINAQNYFNAKTKLFGKN